MYPEKKTHRFYSFQQKILIHVFVLRKGFTTRLDPYAKNQGDIYFDLPVICGEE